MISSLGKLAALPDDTLVYCAHEYTLSNLRFARGRTGQCGLQERVKVETDKREHDVPTVPSTIGLEKATNPFLRYREPAIAEQLVKAGRLDRIDTPLATFTALRLWKNDF
jgi:hydroxyacylglutathione hydrolase